MRYMKYLIVILVFFMLSGCTNLINFEKDSRNLLSDTAFEYIGTWKVASYENISSEISYDYYNYEKILDYGIQIEKNRINIFNQLVKDVRYKLKVVDKSYIISYEYNLTAEKFISDKENLDIISVIDDNVVLCELIIIDKDNVVLIYNSILIYLNKVSDKVIIKEDANNISDSSSINYNENNDEGVMIGIKTPRRLNEDGSYSQEEYRTIWIAYKNNEIYSVYEKENIIFPRMNGIWQLELKTEVNNDNNINYFEVSSLDGKLVSKNEYNLQENIDSTIYGNVIEYKNSSIYKSIEFVGNDYIAIEKYVGDNFINEYPIYQIVPVDNINSTEGLSIEEIFNKDINDKYSTDFKEAYNSILEEELINYSNVIDYNNIKVDRNEGKWVLKGKIDSNLENRLGKEFILSIEPNKKLINFNSLLLPWKNLKGEIPFIEDAIASPNGAIAIVQYNKNLGVYRIDAGRLYGSPLINIYIEDDEEIIMTEWCSSGYVDEWQKAFVNGKKLR